MRRFGAFEGVFTPTILCILGVIMYLRLGWVVGQAGLRNALIIVVAANLISLFTGLSLSSMVTNIRIGHGGVYSIITKSLGYEMGGAIGLPLFLAQALSIAFYVTGFAEAWAWIFPNHPIRLVALLSWLILFFVAYTSARLAFRLQYLLMGVIGLSLVSMFLSPALRSANVAVPAGVGEIGFWTLFAVFFPAITGILAGVSMSGELKNPGRDILRGTLGAILVGFLIYLLLTFWYARVAAPGRLAEDNLIAVNLARWPTIVLAGIMGATLSSALSLMVAAPRVLYGLAGNRMIPFSGLFNRINRREEPVPAITLSAALALATILAGTLDSIAVVLTLFFLLTYAMINLSVLVEQGIGIPSFRPAFRVPLAVPFLGTIGCVAVLFLINAVFGIVSVVAVALLYMFLVSRNVRGDWPDVRRGLFVFLAEKALRTAGRLPYHPKIWKPNLLVPVGVGRGWHKITPFISDLASPTGRVTLLRIGKTGPAPDGENLDDLGESFRAAGLLTDIIGLPGSLDSLELETAIAALSRAFLPPNLIFLMLGREENNDPLIARLLSAAETNGLGTVLLFVPDTDPFGDRRVINLWLRPGSPNLNLGVLTALQLQRNWQGRLRLVQTVGSLAEREKALSYIRRLRRILRITGRVESIVLEGSFLSTLDRAPPADLNLFGMQRQVELSWVRRVAAGAGTAVVFFQDSRRESARA